MVNDAKFNFTQREREREREGFLPTWNAHLFQSRGSATEFLGHHAGENFWVLGHHLDGLFSLFL
jgi:1,4-alpha-glucan branching enzyme